MGIYCLLHWLLSNLSTECVCPAQPGPVLEFLKYLDPALFCKNATRSSFTLYVFVNFLRPPPRDSCFHVLKWSLVHWGTIYHKSSRGIFHDNFDPQMPDYIVHMDLNSYEQTGHHCKPVQWLQEQEDSPNCIAYYYKCKPLLLTMWHNTGYKPGSIEYLS